MTKLKLKYVLFISSILSLTPWFMLLKMDFQEQFYKEQIRMIQEARDAKEEDFERLQQDEREKAKQSIENASNTEDIRQRYICNN